MAEIAAWFLDNLVCPVDKSSLRLQGNQLVSEAGRRYPIIDGVPMMLVDEAEPTIGIASASLARARSAASADDRAPELYLESLGIGETEKQGIVRLASAGNSPIDPVIAHMVGATSGYAYKHLIGSLRTYPIPHLRLPPSNGARLLDIGCNWGRWSLAAERKGYVVTGIDPSVGAIMAARRAARELSADIRYLVADGRFLPFRDGSYENVFSYSVLQHMSHANVRLVLAEVARVLATGGLSLIQMANRVGVRSIYHQARRRFRTPSEFDVRYWSLSQLRETFVSTVGVSAISVDCYFGLGLQKADSEIMMPAARIAIAVSEVLRRWSERIPLLVDFADSVYVESVKSG
jgi:SAM-dependent methyltransferase/uncharacterized protein YbaR (Trm112 family)